MNQYNSAEDVQDANGRQYHIGLAPGEVAPNLILVGDPARAKRCSLKFDEVTGTYSNREYVTYTGRMNGIDLSVMATGIGCDNTEIALVELGSLLKEASLIRVGTCGALQEEIKIGDLVVSWAAQRMEVTSLQYVPEGYPAVAHPDVIQALIKSAKSIQAPHHFGITATASGFYGAQGREIDGFPARNPNLEKDLRRLGLANMEMECSTLFTLASLRGWKAGAVCTAFANRIENHFVKPANKTKFEDRALDCGLAALAMIAV